MMERTTWLKQMRSHAEALYDQLAPAYWVTFGLYANETHRQFIAKLLRRLGAQSAVLDAACGAGRYDAMLLEAGHSVVAIDQSKNMLTRAREVFPQERFPRLRFEKMSLQELDFRAEFDGLICIDAMEHVCAEDWPDILTRFHEALKPSGLLYVTVEVADWDVVREAYERAKAMGLPVVPGEVVDKIDTSLTAMDWHAPRGEQADPAVYHFYPRPDQVRAWFEQAGLTIEEEATGNGYWHILAMNRPSGP